MPKLRSLKTMEGREMAGARALWHATGTKVEDFGKPVICVVNSYTQFVPGHVHLKDLGQVVARAITGAIMSLSGDIIAINLDLSKLPIVSPTVPSKNLIAVDLDS